MRKQGERTRPRKRRKSLDARPLKPKYDFTVPPPPERPTSSPADRRELRRLLRIYGREEIVAAARKVPIRGPGRYPPRAFKPECPPLKPLDVKELARQVRKFGRKTMAEAAKRSPLRGKPGKPPDPNYWNPDTDPENVARSIEMWAHEYRLAGSRTPYKDAEHELYELLHGRGEDGRDVLKFRKTIKKLRLQGRRELLEYAARLRQQNPVRFRDDNLDWLRWLYRNHS